MNDQTDGEEARCLVCQWNSVRPTREFALADAKDHWLDTGHAVVVDED